MIMIRAFLFFVLLYRCNCSYSDEFHEELLLKPLYSDHLYAYFQFSTIWNVETNKETFHHCHLFPRALGEIIGRYDVQELHISLTSGLWRYEFWGYPVLDAAPGAEIWAWFKPGTQDINSKWKELASSLSGLLCASLNFINTDNSVSPEFSYRPSGCVKENVNSTYLRYASLPREIVCTENLTPWKKLLPCDSKKGLATLLNAGHIHNTRYHSVSLHLRPVCRNKACDSTSLELRQSISLVYDYLILGTRNWSFRKLFGQGLFEPCPLATSSVVYVDTTSNNSATIKLNPAPAEYVSSIRGGEVRNLAKYDLHKITEVLNIVANYPHKHILSLNSCPMLYANQYIAGIGQEYGSIVIKIYNNHWAPLDVVLLQNLPWYVPVFMHTLSIKSNGNILKPKYMRYVPGKQRVRSYHIEMLLRLPPQSVTVVSVDFEYVFLKWQEYPPDANHGFYIGSAVISSYLPLARNFTGLPSDGTLISSSFNASRSGYLVNIKTECLLITLPTPDFSMPYNVICLACTVVALAFGPLHNITTKRLVLKAPQRKGLIQRLKLLFSKEKKD